MTEFVQLVKDARDYCVFEKVGEALRIIDPEAVAKAQSSVPRPGKKSVEKEPALAISEEAVRYQRSYVERVGEARVIV